MIGLRLDRLVLPLWNLFERLQPLSDSVQRGIDACPVAGVAAGQSSGAVSGTPCPPAPERPDLLLQAMAIEELYAFHALVWDTPHSIRCHGCGWISHSERRPA